LRSGDVVGNVEEESIDKERQKLEEKEGENGSNRKDGLETRERKRKEKHQRDFHFRKGGRRGRSGKRDPASNAERRKDFKNTIGSLGIGSSPEKEKKRIFSLIRP